MGEYAVRISDGERIKIGTCEDMLYLRFEDRHKVSAENGSVNPNDDREAAARNPADVISWLTYCSYREQRRISPDVSPEAWEKVFGTQTKKLEEYYQREIARDARDRCEK